MAKIYYDRDANLAHLQGRTLAILGYGSQGHAHALNLRDSGLDVIVGLYEGSRSREKAEREGLRVLPVAEAAAAADLIAILLPDTAQKAVYEAEIAPHLDAGKTLLFAHGFNIHFHQITPPADVDVIMIAPKAPGHRAREVFEDGAGVPGLLAIARDATGEAHRKALAYAKGIGCTRAGVIETTFREETETDLFGEQAIICGGVAALIEAGFETLTAAGYQPEIAYFECLHEMKLIVDLIYEGGLSYMRYSVSDTAEYGDYTRGPRIIDEATRAEMKRILAEIRGGRFAREWILENQAGQPAFLAARAAERELPIEKVGARLREMMPWVRRKASSPAGGGAS